MKDGEVTCHAIKPATHTMRAIAQPAPSLLTILFVLCITNGTGTVSRRIEGTNSSHGGTATGRLANTSARLPLSGSFSSVNESLNITVVWYGVCYDE